MVGYHGDGRLHHSWVRNEWHISSQFIRYLYSSHPSGLLAEYRGLVFSIGGDEFTDYHNTSKTKSVARFLMRYNKNLTVSVSLFLMPGSSHILQGFSTGITVIKQPGQNLNAALSGAKANNLLTQVLLSSSFVQPHFAADWLFAKAVRWALLGIKKWVEAFDHIYWCERYLLRVCCRYQSNFLLIFFFPHILGRGVDRSASVFDRNLRQALEALKEGMPFTFVNLVNIFDIAQVW